MVNAHEHDADHGYLTLSQAARLIPSSNGRAASVFSVRRWIKSGCRGVRLESRFIAGRWWTTREWVERFHAEVTRRRLGHSATPAARSASSSNSYLRDKYGFA